MRSAETLLRDAEMLLRIVLLAALAAAVCGCSSLRGHDAGAAAPPPQGEPVAAADRAGAAPGATGVAAQPGEAVPAANTPSSAAAAGAAAPAAAQGAAGAVAKPATPVVDPAAVAAFEKAYQVLVEGRKKEAESEFLALTRAHPELGGPHANLGLIYRETGRLGDAVDELERAVNLSPQQPAFFNQLGIAYREQGQFEKARAAYARAIEIDPGYAAAYLNLGILYDLYLWDGGKALDCYNRYLALSPGGDEKVTKWIADLRNRERHQAAPHSAVSRKEEP